MVTISFVHHGDAKMASYRYRAARPAAYLGMRLNDLSADVLIFAKPWPSDVITAEEAKALGQAVVVDFGGALVGAGAGAGAFDARAS